MQIACGEFMPERRDCILPFASIPILLNDGIFCGRGNGEVGVILFVGVSFRMLHMDGGEGVIVYFDVF